MPLVFRSDGKQYQYGSYNILLPIPNSPTGLTYISESSTPTSAVLSFTPPINAVPSYYIPNVGNGSGTSSAYTIDGLSSNTMYSITLSSANNTGTSTPSTAISILTKPSAPSIGIVTVSGTTATVPFTAPIGTGTITGYTVTSSTGGFTGTGTASPISITGLVAGTSYTFTITATNASGISAASSLSNSINAVSPGLGPLWVIGGNGGQMFYSSNGTTWTMCSLTASQLTYSISSMDYNPYDKILMAVAGTYTLTSTDGNLWTTNTSTGFQYGATKIRYIDSKRIWVVLLGTNSYASTNNVNNSTPVNNIATSSNNGITWSFYQCPAGPLRYIEYSPDQNIWIVSCEDNTTMGSGGFSYPVLIYTSDITSNNWTIILTNQTSPPVVGVDYSQLACGIARHSNGKWVSKGRTLGPMYSTTGTSGWNFTTGTKFTSTNARGGNIHYDASMNWVVACYRGGASRSVDGVNWVSIYPTSGGGTFDIKRGWTATQPNVWVAVGLNSGTSYYNLMVSTDLVTWTQYQTQIVTTQALNTVVFIPP